MRYIDIKNYFKGNKRHMLFLDACFLHIQDLNRPIEFDEYLFIACDALSQNQDIEFYIKLNDFFNENKPYPYNEVSEIVAVKVLLSMVASNQIIMKNIESISLSFFIIHSVIDYGVKIDIPHATHNNFQNTLISLLMIDYKYFPNKISHHLNIFLTYSVLYAKKHYTDYHLVNDLIYNIDKIPNLLNFISDEKFLDFLMQLLDWCHDNKHIDIEKFFNILNKISKETSNEKVLIYTEFSLYRYREIFENDYDYTHLVNFYDLYKEKIDFINRLRILCQLFLKVDRNKYLDLFTEEISQLDENKLIEEIEHKNPNVFSAYIIHLALYKKMDYLNLLHKTYGCSNEVIQTMALYIHSNDATYIFEKEIHVLNISDPDLHFNIIQAINKINNLGITVSGESIEQVLYEKCQKYRENKPIDNERKIEIKLIQYIEKYYFINDIEFDEKVQYILSLQHIRLPLQQLLLKKHDKLFPIVKIINKHIVPEKKVEKIIHIVLSESSTLDQEKEAIEYFDTLTDNIEFEYRYIQRFEELLEILKSDIYSIISITSHGEIDSRNPLNNKIKIGEEYIHWSRFQPELYNINNQRLVYFNICDSGHFSLKNGFVLESLSTYLTNSNQATISHMWPVNQLYSSVFLMVFFHHLISINSFKEAYKETLSLAINNQLDSYIIDNDIMKTELFNLFISSSLNKSSLVHWGSLLYQE